MDGKQEEREREREAENEWLYVQMSQGRGTECSDQSSRIVRESGTERSKGRQQTEKSCEANFFSGLATACKTGRAV